MKKFFHFLKKFGTIGRILIVFGVPLILALPFPPPPFNTDQVKIDLQNGEPAKQEKFRFLTDNNALGASLLQRILNIKTDPMPGYICIRNTSEVSEGVRKVGKDELLDKEGGSISIPLFSDETIVKITVPFASTTCASPQPTKGFAELGNEIKVRGFMPYGEPILQIVNGEPVISVKQYSNLTTIFNMEAKKGYNWKWGIFLKNYVLFLIGWFILLSSIIQVCSWCVKKEELRSN